jgi:hypothetical protein
VLAFRQEGEARDGAFFVPRILRFLAVKEHKRLLVVVIVDRADATTPLRAGFLARVQQNCAICRLGSASTG